MAEIDDRITLLEGHLGMTYWVGDRKTRPDGTLSEAVSSHRSQVIRELIRLHRIDVIHSRGWRADRLIADVETDPSIPWFIDLCDPDDYREDTARDPEFSRYVEPLLSRIHGVFYARPTTCPPSRCHRRTASDRSCGSSTVAIPTRPDRGKIPPSGESTASNASPR